MSSSTGPSPASAQVGVVGLAVMGSNLARNFASRGYAVALYNRTQARTDAMMAAFGAEGAFVPATSVAEFVASLERPRRIIMMVQAGAPTDATIATLLPLLEPGDIPVFVIMCRTQEVHVYKNKKTGILAAGMEDKVQQVTYAIGVTRIPEDVNNPETRGWKFIELQKSARDYM